MGVPRVGSVAGAGVTSLSVLWDVVGFSLVFGQDVHGVIGNLDHVRCDWRMAYQRKGLRSS